MTPIGMNLKILKKESWWYSFNCRDKDRYKLFPKGQFIIQGFHKPFRLDISDKNGGY